MIKEYRKISTIKAEQFDGSKEQIQKYAIDAVDLMDLYGAQGEGSAMRYTLPTKKGPMECHIGDWIATGALGEHWAIAEGIFDLTYRPVEVAK